MRGGLRGEEQTDTEKMSSSTENRTRRGWKDKTARKKMESREGQEREGGVKGRGRQKRENLKRLLGKAQENLGQQRKTRSPRGNPSKC